MTMDPQKPQHIPVLAAEVLHYFENIKSGIFVDCTLGLASHSTLLLEHHPELQLIGLDRDDQNLARAAAQLKPFSERVRLVQANFADLTEVLTGLNVQSVSGILADLGLSSNQIADPARGLSFDIDGPLDMRLDRRQKTTAADLVNTMGEGELSDLLYLQSQERHSRRIAKRICQERHRGRINSTLMLARIVAFAVGVNPDSHYGKIHPATRTFMALRIAVNQETQSLSRLLAQVPQVLDKEGRVAVISFHSVEDKLVKEDFRTRGREGTYEVLTKKPVAPDDNEQRSNPRSRSAKMRVASRR